MQSIVRLCAGRKPIHVYMLCLASCFSDSFTPIIFSHHRDAIYGLALLHAPCKYSPQSYSWVDAVWPHSVIEVLSRAHGFHTQRAPIALARTVMCMSVTIVGEARISLSRGCLMTTEDSHACVCLLLIACESAPRDIVIGLISLVLKSTAAGVPSLRMPGSAARPGQLTQQSIGSHMAHPKCLH